MAQRIRRKPMSDINVVPYIDVMLVLLVIFMITTPLLTEGVKVDLPRAAAQALEAKQAEPLVISVNEDGSYYLNIGDEQNKPVDHATLVARVAAVMRHKPETQVVVRGDRNVKYEKVVIAMALLQKAGVPSVGLVTKSPDEVN